MFGYQGGLLWKVYLSLEKRVCVNRRRGIRTFQAEGTVCAKVEPVLGRVGYDVATWRGVLGSESRDKFGSSSCRALNIK